MVRFKANKIKGAACLVVGLALMLPGVVLFAYLMDAGGFRNIVGHGWLWLAMFFWVWIEILLIIVGMTAWYESDEGDEE